MGLWVPAFGCPVPSLVLGLESFSATISLWVLASQCKGFKGASANDAQGCGAVASLWVPVFQCSVPSSAQPFAIDVLEVSAFVV